MQFGKRKALSFVAIGALGVAGLLASAGIAGAASAAPPGSMAEATPSAPVRPVVVLTQADNGKTVNVMPGTYVVVDLGTTLNWRVTSSNPAVISQIPFSSGQSGDTIFQAHQPGQATLDGLGRPRCEPGQACPLFIAFWQVHINVIGIVPLADVS